MEVPKVGDKVLVTNYHTKYTGKTGEVYKTGSMFFITVGRDAATYSIRLKDGESLRLLRHEFEVIE